MVLSILGGVSACRPGRRAARRRTSAARRGPVGRAPQRVQVEVGGDVSRGVLADRGRAEHGGQRRAAAYPTPSAAVRNILPATAWGEFVADPRAWPYPLWSFTLLHRGIGGTGTGDAAPRSGTASVRADGVWENLPRWLTWVPEGRGTERAVDLAEIPRSPPDTATHPTPGEMLTGSGPRRRASTVTSAPANGVPPHSTSPTNSRVFVEAPWMPARQCAPDSPRPPSS
jgi:hypothetical protein